MRTHLRECETERGPILEVEQTLRQLVAVYREEHRAELSRDPEFARWLEEDYAPIAGGWHY